MKSTGVVLYWQGWSRMYGRAAGPELERTFHTLEEAVAFAMNLSPTIRVGIREK